MRIHTMKTSRFRQLGLSLAEMLIGLVVGLIVVGIVGTLFITTLRGSDDTLRAMKLNQELRAAMNYMANDIRRAGFWAVAANPTPAFYTTPPYVAGYTPPDPPYDNPYTVRAAVAGVTTVTTDVFVANNCIMYSYDRADNDGLPNVGTNPITPPPRYVFRRVVDANGNGVIEVPSSNALGTGTNDDINNGCAATVAVGAVPWTGLTDPNAVNITQLDFSFEGSRCENLDDLVTVGGVSSPRNWQSIAGATAPACTDNTATGYVAPAAGDRLVESRQVRIQLSGNHVKDPTVTLTLDETIKIPNNRVVIFPGP